MERGQPLNYKGNSSKSLRAENPGKPMSYDFVRSAHSSCQAVWMASSFLSLDFAGSPANPGSSVIHLCMSVKRTEYGSTSGNLSVNAMAMSSKLSQSNVCGIDSSLNATPRSLATLVVQFLGVIFIPMRNFDDDVGGAVGNGLAAQAGLRRDSWRFIEFIEFGVSGFVARFQAFFDHHVAGGAGANAAAGVIKSGLERFGKIEDASRQSIVAIRNLRGIDFQRFAAGQKSNLELLGRRLVLHLFNVRITATHRSSLPNNSCNG